MHGGDSVLAQVEFLQLFGVREEIFRQSLDHVSPQKENAKFREAVKSLITDLADFIVLQLELQQILLGSEGPIADCHDFVMAQVHFYELCEEAGRKEDRKCLHGNFFLPPSFNRLFICRLNRFLKWALFVCARILTGENSGWLASRCT